jgi:hypothetical protein
MDPEHYDARNMISDALFLLPFVDVCQLLAHLAGQNVLFWILSLYKLSLCGIFLDGQAFSQLYCKLAS